MLGSAVGPATSRSPGDSSESGENGGPLSPLEHLDAGVKISEHMPRTAKQMHHLSIIRLLDSKEGNHDRGTYRRTRLRPQPDGHAPGFGSGSLPSTTLARSYRTSHPPHCIAINRPRGGPPAPCRSSCRSGCDADRQPAAAQGRRGLCMDRRLHMLGQVENQFLGQRKPGGCRSQGRLRQDAADDEPLPGRLQPRVGARRGPRDGYGRGSFGRAA